VLKACGMWVGQDTEVFYDLKKMLEESGAQVPGQLASHEASRNKPGAVGDRPRREQTVYIA
jgi:ATP-dependent RNA helicase DDX23/PRP28